MTEMQRVNDFEDNWLGDSDDEDSVVENHHHHHQHHVHSHDDADTDQQSVSDAGAPHLRGRRHENESVSTAISMYQAGYRDGAAKGNEVAFQNRFDAGFERGMIIGRLIGELWLEIQKTLKQLPKPSDTHLNPPSNITTSISPDNKALEIQVTQTSQATLHTEAALLRAQAEKCLSILLKDLPELLATVSPAATAPLSSQLDSLETHGDTAAHDIQESLRLSATLASVVLDDTSLDHTSLDHTSLHHTAVDGEVARLQQIRRERQEIASVLRRLRHELRLFPAVALLVFEDLVSQMGLDTSSFASSSSTSCT